jgi:NAD(P)-dependent dehydrogenase (short-subunit alcohol dehydrogenase family)
MQLRGKIVIVTGASAGIGRATAIALAAAGAHVVASARRDDRLQDLVTESANLPGRLLAVAGDISRESFAHELVNRTIGEWGGLDVLINNAGVGHNSLLSEITAEQVQAIWNTNVNGLLWATQAALPHLKKQRRGQIVNVSSIVGQRPLLHSAVYCASKAAVNALTRSLRMELRPYKVTVTLVYPGLTQTEFFQARLGNRGRPRGLFLGVPAERAAGAIVRAVRYRRTEVYVTWYDWLFTHLNRLFPRTTDFLAGRLAGLYENAQR